MMVLVALLGGCGGLQEVWEGPGAKVFRPQTIAVLPPMASQYDSAREDIQEVLAVALNRQGNIERVVSPRKRDRYLPGLERSVRLTRVLLLPFGDDRPIR